MPQFDPTYFASQVFWLIVIFGAMYLVLARVALPRLAALLETREAQISDNLAKARELQKEADYLDAENRRMQRETRDQARAIVDAIRVEIATEIADRQRELHAVIDQRVDAAEARIATERQQALSEMRTEMASLVTAACTRLTGTTPSPQRVQQILAQQLTH